MCAIVHPPAPAECCNQSIDVAITVDLRIDYIAPLTAGNAALAEARVLNRGRTIGRCECNITEEASGRLLSRGTTVFVIRPRQRW